MTATGDRIAIIEATIRMGLLADVRDWKGLRAVLADEVRLDYSSLDGGEPVRLSGDAVVDGWRETLEHLDATQHLIGGHLVDVAGDRATCQAQFQATHVLATPLGGSTWTLGGRYHYELTRSPTGWLISAVTMTAIWGTGNQRIMV